MGSKLAIRGEVVMDEKEALFARHALELSREVHKALHAMADGSGFGWFQLKSNLEGATRSGAYSMSFEARIETIALTLRTGETAAPEIIQVSIGSDANWNPLVSVLSTKTDEAALPVSGVVATDLPLIESAARRCLLLMQVGN